MQKPKFVTVVAPKEDFMSTKKLAVTIDNENVTLREKSAERRLLAAQLRARKLKYVIASVLAIVLMYTCVTIVKDFVIYVSSLQDTVTDLEGKVKTLTKYSNMYDEEKMKTLQLQDQITELNTEIDGLNATINNLTSTIKTCDENIEQLKADNIDLNKTNKQLNKQLKEASKRLQTYEKYKYAVIDGNHRTDLTYEEIKLGEEIMKEKGYDPNILFSIGMVESNFTRNCTSNKSTAKGYCQFLDGTAKYTYEVLLGNGKGSWKPSVAYDGKTNIKMCAAYFDYLVTKHKDFYKAMGQYCGAGTGKGSFTYTYIARMNKYSSKAGANMYKIIEQTNKMVKG